MRPANLRLVIARTAALGFAALGCWSMVACAKTPSAGAPALGVFAHATSDQQPIAAIPSAAARANTRRKLAGRIRRLGIETLAV